jgi:dephospho-CoA kinase
MMVVAMTGGIGSGKSTASGMFVKLGVPVIDTDHIAHGLTAPGGQAIASIASDFGNDMLDSQGGLDRQRMRALVFSAPSAKARLEGLLHPLILAECKSQIATLAAPYILLVVPLLLESTGFRELAQRILVVDCTPQLQIQRAISRGGITEEEIRSIIATQVTREERLSMADDILDNCGGPDDLKAQVVKLDRRYRELAKHL